MVNETTQTTEELLAERTKTHGSFEDTMRNSWSNNFYRLYEDFEYGVIDVDQFKAKLLALGFPQGYIDWLVYMSTRPE